MPPHLPSSNTRQRGPESYWTSLKQLFSFSSPPSHTSRARLLRSLVTRSVAIPLSRDGRILLPVRVRPAMIFFTFSCLIMLGLLGLTPSPKNGLPIPDKSLHFLSFFLSTLLFYFIFSIPSSTLSHTPSLRHFPLFFTLFVCLGLGGIISEFVQGALPYRVFDGWDIVANLFGGGLGLALARYGEGEWKRRKEIRRLYTSIRQGEDFDLEDGIFSEGEEDAEEEDEEDWRRRGDNGGLASSGVVDLEDPWSARDDGLETGEGGEVGRNILKTSTQDQVAPKKSTSTSSQQQQQPLQESSTKLRGEDLFSIDDEDD